MPYSKNTWAKGDTVTSVELNHIEDGIVAAEPLVLTYDTLNMSAISEAVRQGRPCIMYSDAMEGDAEGVSLAYVTNVMHDAVAGKYIVAIAVCNTDGTVSPIQLAADTPDGELTPYGN